MVIYTNFMGKMSLNDISTNWTEILLLEPTLYAFFVVLVEAWKSFDCLTILVILKAN